jgi:hypothetical protein
MTIKNNKTLADLLKSSKSNQPLKIADLIVTTGLSIGATPLEGAIYSFAKFGADSIRKYFTDRSESKIYEFHRKLLLNDNDQLDESILESTLEIAEYHALLQACLAEIEDKKTAIYGNLAKAIARNTVPKELRRHLILTLKEINWDQLDLLARVYVLSRGDIIPSTGPGNRSPTEAITAEDPYSAKGIDSAFLKLKSLISDENITPIGRIFSEACLPSDNLEPEAFEYKKWTGMKYCTFLLDEYNSTPSGISKEIDSYFRDKGIEGGMGPMEGTLDSPRPIPLSNFFLIAYRNGKTLSDTRKQNLIKKIGNKPSLQIIYTNTKNDTPHPILESEFLQVTPQSKELAPEKAYATITKIINKQKEQLE